MAFLAAIPAALGSIGSGTLGLLGAGVSAVGAIAGGIAQRNMNNYQAEVAANNAKIAQQNATAAEQAGQEQAAAQSRKSAAMAGQILATQAANNVDVNSGSAVDVQVSQRETGKLDTANTLRNAEMQAYGYRTQSTNYEAQAALDRKAASNAPISAMLGATGGFLGSASSLSSKWTGGDNTVLGNI